MKTFYASLAVFALLIVLIGCNTVLIGRISREIECFADSLCQSDDLQEEAAKLEAYWKEKRPVVGLSVCDEVLLQIDEQISEAAFAAKEKKTDDLQKAVRLLKESMVRLRRAERVSIDNLF
jgi:hypothetical protein